MPTPDHPNDIAELFPAPKRPGLGCWVKPALFALASLALGLYIMFGRTGVSPGEMVGALVLVLLGVLVLLPVIAWLLFIWWIGRLKRQLQKDMESLSQDAKLMLGRSAWPHDSVYVEAESVEVVEPKAEVEQEEQAEGNEAKPWNAERDQEKK